MGPNKIMISGGIAEGGGDVDTHGKLQIMGKLCVFSILFVEVKKGEKGA